MSLTAAQLIERRQFLGASEAGAAVGESPWFSPLELYQSKKGTGKPIETTLPMLIGTALEPICLEMFQRETALEVSAQQQQFTDPSLAWRRCTVDGYVKSEDAIVEAKTSGDFKGWGEQGTDEIPLQYLFNIAHSFLVIPSAKKAYFPVIIGRSFRLYQVERNEELLHLVDAAEVKFWTEHVLKDVPPDPRDREDVKLLYPRSLGVTTVATALVEERVGLLRKAKDEVKKIKLREESLAFEIAMFMGASDTLVNTSGEILATHKSQERKEFVTKASNFRVLRLK